MTEGEKQAAGQKVSGYLPAAAQTPQPQDPLDYTNRYNTPLAPDQEFAYQRWLQLQSAANNRDMSGDTRDYDMQGAFLSGAGQSANQHWPDTFKKPNHPSFSTQSQYHGVDGNQGGAWMPTGDGRYLFSPGPTNLQLHGVQGLQNYFQRQDPNVSIGPPAQQLAPPQPMQNQQAMQDYVRRYLSQQQTQGVNP